MLSYNEVKVDAREIPLTQGQVALVDASDYDWLMQWKWCAQRHGDGWYAVSDTKGSRESSRRIHMHRMVMNAPDGFDVDHIDNNGLNNTRANLRLATRQQNLFNKPISNANKSGYKGVCWCKRKGCWVARIQRDRKQFHLGYFESAEDAARAYDCAAREMFGEYAFLNFPGSDVSTPPPAKQPRSKGGRRPSKLTDAQVVEVQALVAKGVSQRDIASRFGITQAYVSQLRRRMWRKSAAEPTVAVVNHVESHAPLTGNPANVPPADFAAAIAEMEALPETLADVTDPYSVGCLEAEQGLRCEPLNHYAKLGDIEQYVWGWKDATAALHEELEATLDDVFAPVPVDERQLELDLFDYDAEAEDYEEYLLDQQYHASGQW